MKIPAAIHARGLVAPLAIAIADDIFEIQQLAREWLVGAGHAVTCVANGLELTRLVRETHLDVVITDVMMPERDGLEVITELKKSHPALRIIAMSGGGAVMHTADCLRVAKRLGADAVLSKPFNRAQLMKVLQEAVATATQATA